MKTTISAIAILVAMSAAANAACNVTQTGLTSHSESDCASAATVAAQGISIGTLQTDSAEQQEQLDDHEDRIGATETKNVQQDHRLNIHKQAIIANYGWDLYQQGMLNDHKSRIGSLEEVASAHEGRLNAHDAILSQHSATLDDHAKGLAIAMSLPDAWLSDKKRFGIFGSVGGFDDETAIGFAAIGRIDETWSVNAKLGSDIEFGHVGWQVGAGAQW